MMAGSTEVCGAAQKNAGLRSADADLLKRRIIHMNLTLSTIKSVILRGDLLKFKKTL